MKKKLLLTILALLSAEFSIQIKAYDAHVNGFYYNLNKSARTAQVTSSYNYNDYSGQVTIPSSISYEGTTYNVTSIGNSAFNLCSSLTSVTIPNSVTSIGWAAFNRCTGLTAITIPESVTSIDGVPFCNCTNLSSITVASGNTVYDSRNNCNAIIKTNTNKLVVACATSSIPSNVESIGSYAFSYLSLNSVNIPNSVKSIEQNAFLQCQITSLFIGAGVTSIEAGAFDNTVCSSIVVASGNTVYDSRNNCNAIIKTNTNALIKGCNNTTIPNNVTSIEESAFYGCSRLTSVTIPNSVTSIGKSAFYGTGWYNNQADGLLYLCNWLLDYKGSKPSGAIELSEGTKGIAAYALDGCSGLTSVNIPNSVLYINNYAFHNCSGLTSVNIPNSVTSIGCAFWGCSSLASVNIPNSVTSIDGYTFYNCSGLSSVTIPNSLTSIGSYAFYGCSGLSSITIPNSVTSIGSYAFNNCNNLTSVTVLNETPVNIEQYTFSNRTNATLHVPSGTKTAYQAKPYWKQFHEIVEIANNIVFEDANVKAICIAQWDTNGDQELSETEAAAVTDLGTVFKAQSNITSFNELQYFTGLTSIGSNAFSGCSGLTSVNIPNSVTSIGMSAFYGCSGLTSVTIGNGVTYIGESTFYRCSGLTSIEVESGNTKYDSRSNCNAIIESATNTLICGCKNTTIPNSVTSIGYEAFYGCSGLTSVTIPNSVTSIGTAAFASCCSLTSVTIPNRVTRIGTGAFSDCTDLTSITIPNSITSIGNYAFRNCSSLTSVTIPNRVTSIGSSAFNGCSKLTSVITEKETPISIGSDVFPNRANTKLYVPKGAKTAYTTANYWTEFKAIKEFPDGDVNEDGETDVVDVVDIARTVIEELTGDVIMHLADLNNSNSVTVADAIVLINDIAGDTNWAKPMMAQSRAAANDVLKLVSSDGNNLSLQMDGNGQYAAFQFDLWLPENVDVMEMALNNERRQGHQLLYNKMGEGHYRVVALSTAANIFKGSSGELLDMTLDGFATDNIQVDDIRFVTPEGSERLFDALGVTRNGIVTSIDGMNGDDNCDKRTVYNLNGQRMNTPQRGLNIINGRKVVIK